MQLEGGSDILRALSYYYYNDYAAVDALAGAVFEIVAKDMSGHGCTWLDMSGHGWTWLDMGPKLQHYCQHLVGSVSIFNINT